MLQPNKDGFTVFDVPTFKTWGGPPPSGSGLISSDQESVAELVLFRVWPFKR